MERREFMKRIGIVTALIGTAAGRTDGVELTTVGSEAAEVIPGTLLEAGPQRMVLETGDIIVLKCPGALSGQAVTTLRRTVETVFPGHPVCVLQEGMDLQIIHKVQP